MQKIEFKDINIITHTDEIFTIKNIYSNSFPANERVPFEWLISSETKLINYDNKFTTFSIRFNNQTVGMLSFYKSKKYVFVLYFAIIDTLRGIGIGSLVLKKFHNYFETKYIYEIEFPKDEISNKRIKFYKNNGVEVIDYGYKLPPLQKNNEFLPMLIGSYPTSINDIEFAEIKILLYEKVYRYNHF